MAIGIGFILVLLIIFFGWQRKMATSKSVYDELKDSPRGAESIRSDFYEQQLTKKEEEVYQFLKEHLINMEGGILTLPKAIDGKEYQRIVTALEYDRNPFFYGFVDIPMNGEYQIRSSKREEYSRSY